MFKNVGVFLNARKVTKGHQVQLSVDEKHGYFSHTASNGDYQRYLASSEYVKRIVFYYQWLMYIGSWGSLVWNSYERQRQRKLHALKNSKK